MTLSRDRLLFETLRIVRGLNNREAANGTVSASTIRNWRLPVNKGGTRRPQAFTLTKVLEAHGKTLAIVDKD